jgi:hypothetical protein
VNNPFRNTEVSFGSIIPVEDVVYHPQTLISRDTELIAKLNRLAPFFSMMQDKGMSPAQISEVLEALTGLQIKPRRIAKYIKKYNRPVIRITITDRMPKGEG